MNRFLKVAALATMLTIAAPAAAASAHVTLQPSTGTAGKYTRLDIRVPNERPNADTVKIEVQFPADIYSLSYEPTPGWTTDVKKVKLDTPVSNGGHEATERVESVTLTATGEGIKAGQFKDFGLSLRLPDQANSAITFKSVQTYSNGEVVNWIGDPDSKEPAPQVKLTAPVTDVSAVTNASTVTESDSDIGALSIIGLAAGLGGLILGGIALVSVRRNKQTA